jgi:hypothetical protein
MLISSVLTCCWAAHPSDSHTVARGGERFRSLFKWLRKRDVMHTTTNSSLLTTLFIRRNSFRYERTHLLVLRSLGSSVSLTPDWTTGVRSPAEAKGFSSSLCDQTSSEVHPASCSMSTGVLSPAVNRGWDVTLTTHPHLMPRLRIIGSILPSFLSPTWW